MVIKVRKEPLGVSSIAMALDVFKAILKCQCLKGICYIYNDLYEYYKLVLYLS